MKRGEQAAPRIGIASGEAFSLNFGADAEEQLDEQRAMVALLGFELVDLVAAPCPGLVGQAPECAIVGGLAVPAAVEKHGAASDGQCRPISRHPVTIALLGVAREGGTVAWVPRRGELAQGSAATGAVEPVEQDHRAAAMDDLRQLKLCQPIANAVSAVVRRRIASFKYR